MQQLICSNYNADRMMLYRLSLLPEFGSVTIRRLYELYRPFGYTFNIEEKRLKREACLNERQIAAIRNLNRYIEESDRTYNRLIDEGIHVVTFIDREFPERLVNIPQSPAVLYVRGNLPPDNMPSVAIVGSRAATNYGISMAEFISENLAKEGVSIISGMALGIDGAAHRGALKGQDSCTYAVLGAGINICYPKENYFIYDSLADGSRGGLISEVAPGISPLKSNFPMRNRIISGLSDIVIVIEARERSGSLITADYALDQSRELMALPGRITDPLSRGCNDLIASGATILRSPDDVLELLDLRRNGKMRIPEKNINLLAKKEKVVYSTLNLEPKYVQQIVEETGMSYGEVVSILLELELKGLIYQYSAGYYGIM